MKNLTLTDLARAIWRRRVWFLVPLALGLAVAITALRFLPRTYRAVTTVLVEPQKVPADYVKPTVTSSIEERLRTIEPQIKNRDNLERIVSEMDLYPELRRRGVPMEQLVAKVRDDLTVRLQGDTFLIYFVGRDPVKAARTANRVAELFIDSNLQLRENQAQGTSIFLESELQKTKHRLEVQEAKIADFKRRNMGNLPEQRDTNLRAVEQLQTKLEINMDAVDKAETRRLLLQTQLAEMRNQPVSRPSRRSVAAAPGAPPSADPPTRLEQLRAQLAELRARYTDRHPDVIRTRSEIAQLELMEKSQAAAAKAAAAKAPATDAAPVDLAETEARPRLDPMLKADLASVDLEIRSLRAERERIMADISRTQGRLENVPTVEQELLGLTRDYDNIKNSYDSLLDKRLNARLYENLEKSQQGERFTILEKALAPTSPYGPNKLLVLGLGLIAGALLGLLSALLRERSDPTYLDAQSLQQAFPGLPLLATIPVFQGAESARRIRRR